MPHQFDVKPDKRSGSMVGATLTMFLGSIAAGIIFGFLGSDAESGVIIFVCGVGLIFMFLALLRTRPVGNMVDAVSWMVTRHREDELNYQPGPRVNPTPAKFGTQAPSTPDEVRDIKAGGNNWVPAAGSKSPRPSSRRRPPK